MSNGGTIIQARQVNTYGSLLDPLSLGEIVFNVADKSLGIGTVSTVNWMPEITLAPTSKYILSTGVKLTGKDSNGRLGASFDFYNLNSLNVRDSNNLSLINFTNVSQTTKFAPSNQENNGAAYLLYYEPMSYKNSQIVGSLYNITNSNPTVYIPHSNLVVKGSNLINQNNCTIQLDTLHPHQNLANTNNGGSLQLKNKKGSANESSHNRLGVGFKFSGSNYPTLKGIKLSSRLPKYSLKTGYTLFAQVVVPETIVKDFAFKTTVQNKSKTKKYSQENHAYGQYQPGKPHTVGNIVFKIEDYMFTQLELDEGLIVDWLDEGSIVLTSLGAVNVIFNTFGIIPNYSDAYKNPLIEVLHDPVNHYASSGQYNNLIQMKMSGGDLNYLNFNKKMLNDYRVELQTPVGVVASIEDLTEDGFTIRPTVYPNTSWKLNLYVRPIV